MSIIRRSELVELLEAPNGQRISLYMPANFGADSRQNSIRLKNLLGVAERTLAKHEVGASTTHDLLAPAWERVDDIEFWKRAAPGIGVLLDRNGARFWRLPFTCKESCTVGRRYYIRPLLRWFTNDAPYYVLAVSQNAVCLLRGTRTEIEEVTVPDLPTNREQALGLDDPERRSQMHTGQRPPGRLSKQSLVFHGQGGAVDAAKPELAAYLRKIDHALAKVLQPQTEPLLFAGVEYLFPIFQAVNRYPHLLPTPITGNPDSLSLEEIRERAWPIVATSLTARRDAELARYGDSIAGGLSSNDVEQIVLAAHAGAIDTLLIDSSRTQWGTLDPESYRVRLDESRRRDSEELLNLAACFVLRSGGWIETMPAGKVPDRAPMAAVMRFRFALSDLPKPLPPNREVPDRGPHRHG